MFQAEVKWKSFLEMMGKGDGMMHDYSVVPNQGENGLVVKIQNTAPSGTYSSRSEAIALAKN
ncbi:hypothetical protein [Fictibacillus sp. NRS-1165]|uniref:hypothetical protein n=1 Tax=Fictibacillus sp. NRS-1165 TaxID=3144463 RepID=UPI003D234BFE